jgi:mono/diheme cytochrome c family protein
MRWLALLLLCAACDRNDGTPASSQHPLSQDELPANKITAGELTYRRYCIGCHGDDGKGNAGVTGADLTAPNGPLRAKDDAELLVSVRDGKTGKLASMPAHRPVLNDDQIRAVLAFAHQRFAP